MRWIVSLWVPRIEFLESQAKVLLESIISNQLIVDVETKIKQKYGSTEVWVYIG